MRQHILIEKSHRYKDPISDPVPAGCTYQAQKGYWTKNDTDEVMMLSNDPCTPQSKKCDRETGEDQKGE